jgi:hypothetical protein
MELLGDDPWRERRELALEVYYGNIIRLDAAVQYDDGNSVQVPLMIAITLIEVALPHTNSPRESIPFLLKRLDCEGRTGKMGSCFDTGLAYSLFEFTNGSAAHLLGPGLALPVGDSKAESWAESMLPRIEISEEEILATADLPPLQNETMGLLQEVLERLSKLL